MISITRWSGDGEPSGPRVEHLWGVYRIKINKEGVLGRTRIFRLQLGKIVAENSINLDGAIDLDNELEGGKKADEARQNPHCVAEDGQVPEIY